MGDAAQTRAKQVAASQLLSLLGVGAATGVGVRGLMGLRDMVTSRQQAVSPSSNLPHTISLYGPPKEEEPQKSAITPMRKMAEGPPPVTGGPPATWVQRLASKIGPLLPETHTSNPIMSEWGIPAGAAALAGGGAAGYGLTDWLLNKVKARQGTKSVESAEDEYRNAIADQYRSAMLSKSAGDDCGLSDLADVYVEQLAGGMTKEAVLQSFIDKYVPGSERMYSGAVGGYDNWQKLKGGVNTAALMALLGTGKVTYDWAKGQNKQELLQKALQRRQAMRQQMSPPPIIALTEEDSQSANNAA